MDVCDQCGFRYDESDAPGAPQQVRDLTCTIAERLTSSPRAVVERRVPPLTWSALEYTCHLRDVLLVQRERVLLARREDHPSFVPMGRDERAAHDGYASQDPTDVARQLVEAGRLFANALDLLDDASWDRMLVYNYPESADHSLRWVAVHTVHELVHHHGDIDRLLAND